MPWLKHVVVDLALTVLIGIAVFVEANWAWWILVVYTPLMVVLKAVAAFSGGVRSVSVQRRGRTEPPMAFYHALYALDVALLAVGEEWLLALGWLVIWVLSIIAAPR